MARELSIYDFEDAFPQVFSVIARDLGIPLFDSDKQSILFTPLVPGIRSEGNGGQITVCIDYSSGRRMDKLSSRNLATCSGMMMGALLVAAKKHKIHAAIDRFANGNGEIEGITFPNAEALVLTLNSLLSRQEDKLVFPSWYRPGHAR